ncbi:MAG: glucose-6-phosphate isomerase [Butyricicoccaceae bacterium]
MSVSVNLSNFYPFYAQEKLEALTEELSGAHDALLDGSRPGNDFLGWVKLPVDYDKEEFDRILAAAEKIKNESEVLVVIGIGGSYLGARAGIEFCTSPNFNMIDRKGYPQVFFLGNHISGETVNEVITLIGDRDFSINVISKSGTTTEPAIAFRVMKDLLIKKYGDKANDRIYATTDRARGALKSQANACGYESFVVPDNVGGRFSVLSAVGLLPLAAAGIDIQAMMQGAADAMTEITADKSLNNPSWSYAAARTVAYREGKSVEILGCYEPRFHSCSEWWKQLFGESEGKENKGLMPASLDLTTDLHSMGQFVQDGTRIMIETIMTIEKPASTVVIEKAEDDGDGLNYLAGADMDYVNKQAQAGTALAHVDGGVPNIKLSIPEASAYSFGQMVYFFEFAVGLSGYLLDINPFNQPGVEAYKKNMFALLGKPGYEELREELLKKM